MSEALLAPAAPDRRGTQGWNFRVRTHCPRGHEYTPENTRLYEGSRHCRACAREKARERRSHDRS